MLRGLRGDSNNCATVKRFDTYLKQEVSKLVYQYKTYNQEPQLSVDPESKRDVILLPGKQVSGDLQKLKYHAALAENNNDCLIAYGYWLQILSLEFDLEAVNAISRLKPQIEQPKSVLASGKQLGNPGYSASEKLIRSSPQKLSATVPNQSRRKIDYERLTALLKIKQWNLADEETWLLILKMSYREKEGWMRFNDIENMSCHDLYQLDYLWKRASNGKFGLSVQCIHYIDCGLVSGASFNKGIWEDLGDLIGWCKNGDWIETSSINNLAEANSGHFPATNVWIMARGASSTTAGQLMHALFTRIMECNVIEFNCAPP